MCVHVYARGQQASTMSIEVEGVVVSHIVSHSHCVSLWMCVCVGVCVCGYVCVWVCVCTCVCVCVWKAGKREVCEGGVSA